MRGLNHLQTLGADGTGEADGFFEGTGGQRRGVGDVRLANRFAGRSCGRKGRELGRQAEIDRDSGEEQDE